MKSFFIARPTLVPLWWIIKKLFYLFNVRSTFALMMMTCEAFIISKNMFWIYRSSVCAREPFFFLHRFPMTDLFCFQSAKVRDIKHLSWQFSFFHTFFHILSRDRSSSLSQLSTTRAASYNNDRHFCLRLKLHQQHSFFYYSSLRWSFPFENQSKLWINEYWIVVLYRKRRKNQICFDFHFSIIEFSVDFRKIKLTVNEGRWREGKILKVELKISFISQSQQARSRWKTNAREETNKFFLSTRNKTCLIKIVNLILFSGLVHIWSNAKRRSVFGIKFHEWQPNGKN